VAARGGRTGRLSPECRRTAEAQLDKLKDLPDGESQAGIVVKPGAGGIDVGVTGSISEDIGKPGGWFFLAEGSWMRKAGGSIAAMLRRKV
jgi:hypothetical protein